MSTRDDLNRFPPELVRIAVAADVAAFTIRRESGASYRANDENRLCILLICRGNPPYQGMWALPGGFLRAGETIEACALREISEETGVLPCALMPVGVYSRPERDPRGRVVSHAFSAVLGRKSIEERGAADAADARWFDVEVDLDGADARLTLTGGARRFEIALRKRTTRFGHARFEEIGDSCLAFDHAEIIAGALFALRASGRSVESVFDFLPDRFTLAEAQRVYEIISGTPQLAGNFRRKLAPFVEETDAFDTIAGHRPAKLFRRGRR